MPPINMASIPPPPQKLSREQRAVVEAPLGHPIRVMAGPGSGKTHVLTTRVAWLVQQQGVAPNSVVCITFTKKAAAEMSARLAAMGVATGRGGCRIGTFHSVFADLLRQHITGMPGVKQNSNFTIVDQDDANGIVRELLEAIDPKCTTATKGLDKAVYDWISRVKSSLGASALGGPPGGGPVSVLDVAPTRLGGVLAALGLGPHAPGGPGGMRAAVMRVWEGYKSRLEALNYLDFEDLILFTVQLLSACPAVRSALHARWRFVFVDEFQARARLGSGPDPDPDPDSDSDSGSAGGRELSAGH